MRVLLTGATGQIGRVIADHLGRAGHVVVGASRKPYPLPGLEETIAANLGTEDAVERISNSVRPCEAIVHAAASLSHDLHDLDVSLTNCLGTQQIVNVAAIWKTSHIIYISSVPVIGLPQFDPITEEHPTSPRSAYHASKLYGEHLMSLANGNEVRTVSLRITSPCGPGTPQNRILGAFVRHAKNNSPIPLLGRGTRTQNYVDVRDVAAAVEVCLKDRVFGLYNIAAARSISNHELAMTCVDELSSSSSIEFSGKPDPEEDIRWNVSISKAQREIGYYPRFSIRESIRVIFDECRANELSP